MSSVCLWTNIKIFLCLVALAYVHARSEDWNITTGSPAVRTLPPYGRLTLQTQDLGTSNTSSSLICQVHTQSHNVTLSLTSDPHINTAVSGRDIGVITVLLIGQTEARWFLMSHHNFSVTVVVSVTELTEQNPLPGGCNIEFNLENDPNIHLTYSDHSNTLVFQWAAISFRRGQQFPMDCLSRSDQYSLNYDLYVYYLRESELGENSYINAIQQMMTLDTVTQFGSKIHSLTYGDKTKLSVVSYPGQGAIYTVVVTQTGKGSSLYIPVTSYSCSLGTDTGTDSCQQLLKPDVADIIITTLGAIVGLFLCFFGHRFFKTEMFIFGFLALTLVTYIGLLSADFSLLGGLFLAGGMGIVGGVLWYSFWWYLGIPVLSVLLAGLVAGYLFSCLLFFTPFGGLKFWHNRFNYGMTFSCGILILPVVLLIFTRMLNILSCAFVGSFGVVLAADTYLHSNMKYILLSQFDRFFTPGYITSLQTVPFQINEIILSVLWAVLFTSGAVFQYIRERKRPPFPPCPRSKRRARALYHQETQEGEDDERAPLINDRARGPSYSRTRVISFPPAEPEGSQSGVNSQGTRVQ